MRDSLDEEIIAPNPDRFCVFPIRYPDLWDLYRRAVASFWTPEEVSLQQDIDDWKTLSKDEQHFLKHVLAFFATSDGIVGENLMMNFGVEVQIPEARAFYAYQLFNETIHNEQYAILLDSLIRDDAERNTLFKAVHKVPCVRDKAAWALKWLNPEKSFAERLVAYVCVEGILFSGSFCAIFWMKKRGKMPGLALANEFISRDEGLHQTFGTLMYTKYVKHKLPAHTVREIVEEAVENEKAFITQAIPCDLIGMNTAMMGTYIEFIADRILVDLGYPRAYGALNPFDWMELQSLRSKPNFFERFPAEYARAGVMATAEQQTFALDEDF